MPRKKRSISPPTCDDYDDDFDDEISSNGKFFCLKGTHTFERISN